MREKGHRIGSCLNVHVSLRNLLKRFGGSETDKIASHLQTLPKVNNLGLSTEDLLETSRFALLGSASWKTG